MPAPATTLAINRPTVDAGKLTRIRMRRLRTAMEDAGLDALVLTAPESVLYATGYRSVPSAVFRGHRMGVLLTDDDAWLLCPASDTAPAADSGFPEDRLVPFGRFFFESTAESPLSRMADRHDDLAGALTTALGAAGRARKIGVEGLDAVSDLAGVVGEAGVDATGAVVAARSIKQPDEIVLLRYGARLAEEGVRAALDAAGPGTTEQEMAAVVAATMVAGGADPRFVVVTTGPRSALADAVPTDRAWERGELARFDVGCIYAGYWSDIGRTAVLGEADGIQRARYAAIKRGEDEQLAAARPGVTAEELFELAMRTVREHGVRPYRRQHCGHGIGLSIYEPPIVAPGSATALRAGMTFCFETPFYELGWGGMMVEDTLVVTENGVDVFNETSRELRVVDA